MKTLTAGAAAPDFTLEDQNGTATNLGQFRGQVVVVYFYPKAMTPGCTVQACSLRDAQAELAKSGVVVLGLSPDTVKRLKKFEERDELNFTLLSDEDHAVADKFGVWGLKKFMGREYDGIHRMTFIINKEGIIAHVMNKVATKTHHQVVLDWITQNLTGE
jgi:peroxiredoxin Q/BCP